MHTHTHLLVVCQGPDEAESNMLCGEDNKTCCKQPFLSAHEVQHLHHAVDCLKVLQIRAQHEGTVLYTYSMLTNVFSISSLVSWPHPFFTTRNEGMQSEQPKSHFHCAGSVPGLHQVRGPLVLPADEVMEGNSSFPVRRKERTWHELELEPGPEFYVIWKRNMIIVIQLTCPMWWRCLAEWRCPGPLSVAFAVLHL